MSDATVAGIARGPELLAWQAYEVGYYRVVDGRIAHIEQHDCYEAPSPPG